MVRIQENELVRNRIASKRVLRGAFLFYTKANRFMLGANNGKIINGN